ncbi:hypothetical protein KM043_007196 [Ampulex compressa]|nr:hypothetical protein KM043_007196 [Ampulex compressa]
MVLITEDLSHSTVTIIPRGETRNRKKGRCESAPPKGALVNLLRAGAYPLASGAKRGGKTEERGGCGGIADKVRDPLSRRLLDIGRPIKKGGERGSSRDKSETLV